MFGSLPPLSVSVCLSYTLSLSLSCVQIQSVTDMSPYVRKTAAHAIPKLYRYSCMASKSRLVCEWCVVLEKLARGECHKCSRMSVLIHIISGLVLGKCFSC